MRKLQALQLQNKNMTATYQGAQAYAYDKVEPLIHLTFTFGSALFVDGFYESQAQQVERFVDALVEAHKVDPRFVWQYGAWMRDPVKGKGNRIQGSLVAALLDALLDETEYTEEYVAKMLGHRPDDCVAFFTHFAQLGLGQPSASARVGVASALAGFDEYQLMKYTMRKESIRLCDVIAMVRAELEALGEAAQLVLNVGRYLHSSTRQRAQLAELLPLTYQRRALWRRQGEYALEAGFSRDVAASRVSWEQVLGHFGVGGDEKTSAEAKRRNAAVWNAVLKVEGLLPDLAFLRNVRNMRQAGIAKSRLLANARARRFSKVWPHQVYSAYNAVPGEVAVFEEIFKRSVDKLPSGRHLGIGDASGSMCVPVGGKFSSLTSMDVAFCLVGLMSETSGLGASFSDASWFGSYGPSQYLSISTRPKEQSALKFSKNPAIRRGMGGTQVFGAVFELIQYLKQHDHIEPPDCLWFFSDMQFHPAATPGSADKLDPALVKRARRLGVDANLPPLQLAIELYRREIGPVDVVLWNLASYAPVPVPADMPGVLLVSGFDANTFAQVEKWRQGSTREARVDSPVSMGQQAVLDVIREF